MKVRIFVSYCHDDIAANRDRLLVLMNALEERSEGGCEFLADYRHPDAAIGANLPAFMKHIDSADAVLILLTPAYRARVVDKSNTGVYTEFRYIYDRLLKAEQSKSHGSSFLLLPVVFAGTFETSCPSEISYLVARDLTWLHVIPDRATARHRSMKGQPPLRKQVRERFGPFVDELTERIAAVAATKKRRYREQRAALFKEFLFVDTKSRWNQPENAVYLSSLFVKTSVFLRVRDGSVSFVIGRKGAGKSTIAHVLPALLQPPPKHNLTIVFEDLPFDTCYNILLRKPREGSDLRHAFSPIFSYQLLWDAFIHLYFAWVIRNKLPTSSKLRALVTRLLAPVTRDERDAKAPRVLFVHVFEHLMAFVDSAVRTRSNAAGLSETIGRFTPGGFREYVFGAVGWRVLRHELATYDQDVDRIIATCDGFDTMVGYFESQATDPADAARFEHEILLALFQVVLNSGPGQSDRSRLYDLTQFCVAVPYDRFLEARARDRDRYQFRRRVARLDWSGLELSSLIRKRLAKLRDIRDPKGTSLSQRLNQVMETGYEELPNEVGFQFGSAQYRLPLFCYVLRHTFWRPRDVLYFYATLLTAAEAFRMRKEIMPAGFVRQLIAGATPSVIEDEFLGEFATTFRNLSEVIGAFRHCPQVLAFEDIGSRVDRLQFEISIPRRVSPTLAWKLETLYDLGFLGVLLDRNTAARLSSFRHAFIFNEGKLLTEKLAREEYSEFKYVVHPGFVEFLHVDTSANNELILPFDWDYLSRNEGLRGLGPS
jgi:hypothetical protein